MRTDRRAVMLGLAGWGVSGLAGCAKPEVPGAIGVVNGFYVQYLLPDGKPPPLLSLPWTDKLRSLLEQVLSREIRTGETLLGFDPLVDGATGQIQGLTVDLAGPALGDVAIVSATFLKDGAPRQVLFDMRTNGTKWLIENIRTDRWQFLTTVATALQRPYPTPDLWKPRPPG
jgi:hypothetical protein